MTAREERRRAAGGGEGEELSRFDPEPGAAAARIERAGGAAREQCPAAGEGQGGAALAERRHAVSEHRSRA